MGYFPLIFAVFFTSSFYIVYSHSFNNPIFPKHYNAGVLKVGKKYYMVAAGDGMADRLPIWTSKDLETWNFVDYVFTPETYPKWTSPGLSNRPSLQHPKLLYVNGSYNIYFYVNNKNEDFSIGVATATDPAGPYTDIGMPLFATRDINLYYPQLAFNGKFFEMW